MQFDEGGIYGGGRRGDHQRGEIGMRVEYFSLGDVTISFSYGHSEKGMMEGRINESRRDVRCEGVKTVKVKER